MCCLPPAERLCCRQPPLGNIGELYPRFTRLRNGAGALLTFTVRCGMNTSAPKDDCSDTFGKRTLINLYCLSSCLHCVSVSKNGDRSQQTGTVSAFGRLLRHPTVSHGTSATIGWSSRPRTDSASPEAVRGGGRSLALQLPQSAFFDFFLAGLQPHSLCSLCVLRAGYGNTVQLTNGDLVSVYSYLGKLRAAGGKTHVEVVRWRLP